MKTSEDEEYAEIFDRTFVTFVPFV